jgi:hypothetical protein
MDFYFFALANSHGQVRCTKTSMLLFTCASSVHQCRLPIVDSRLARGSLQGLRFLWESMCEPGEYEGESLTALQTEGATRAPTMEVTQCTK